MKQVDDNPLTTEEKPLKKSFLRSLVRSSSSTSLFKRKSKNKHGTAKGEESKNPTDETAIANKNKSKDSQRKQAGLTRDIESERLVEDTLKLFRQKPASGLSKLATLPSSKLNNVPSPKLEEPTKKSNPWIVPDHISENVETHDISEKNAEKAVFNKTTEKPTKQKISLPEPGNHPKDRQLGNETSATHLQRKNPDLSVKPKSQRSPLIVPNPKVICSKKKALAAESPMRRKNKKLVNLIVELRKSCDVYRQEIKRVKDDNLEEVLQLQKENEALNLEVYQITQEIDGWKSKCRKQENRNVALLKVKSLTKKNDELVEDIEVLKSVIHRLNQEMRYYQDKLKCDNEYLLNQKTGYATSSSSCSRKQWNEDEAEFQNEERHLNRILKAPAKKLFPLLVAYDEVIKDKNDIIKQHEEALEHFKRECQAIIHENHDLYEVIGEKKEKGMVSIQEWKFLHENSVIVLEENDLLNEQLSCLKEKENAMIKNHQDKFSKLKAQISLLELEKSELKSATIQTEEHCKMLLEQHCKLAEIMEKRVPVEQHEAAVLECKKLFEDLKISYGDERTVLLEKLSAAENERDRLSLERAELEAENGRIQSNIKTCEDTLATNAAQFREVYNRMVVATNARDSTSSAMEEMMELSQRVVSERENTEQLLEEQRSLNEKLILLQERERELIDELHNKIKAMEDIHQNEIGKMIFRVKELERIISGIGESHRQEMSHLEDLIQEKEKRISHLQSEKGQLQLDLETVWKTTTGTIKDLRNN